MTDATTTFERPSRRLRFTAREAFVTAVSRPVEQYVRVTVSGPDFADFESTGPTDHVRVFFPDPATGELVAPRPVGPGEDGIVRPDTPTFARDFTPLNPRVDPATGHRAIDLDILRHVDPGPAARWGEGAAVGDRLVVVGPRGTKAATQHAPRVLCIVDGTSLPAASRWLAEVPASTRVEVLADVAAGDLVWVEAYLRLAADREFGLVAAAGDDLAAAVRAAGIDDETFVFAAGEASHLVPVRRYLRHDLALPRAQFALSGYWRRGTVAFDHHAPIDPEDPED
ncbi:siderophore-interacting protein [Agromyces bauzanensis]